MSGGAFDDARYRHGIERSESSRPTCRLRRPPRCDTVNRDWNRIRAAFIYEVAIPVPTARKPPGTTPGDPLDPPGTLEPTRRLQPAQLDPVNAEKNRGYCACKRKV